MCNTENNKRIAKNTLLLYFRMLLTMIVSLYTVRIILNTLGVVDYGIYNVVGGIVVMFSFLSNTMAAASQRFFAFELGRNDFIQLKKTFSLTITIYFIIAIVVLILAETIGLWFLNTKIVIPPDRMEAVNWVYQFSILSFIVSIITIPYNAAIIAHENMKVYALVSIIEVILKLIIVLMLTWFPLDKLKLYALLIFITTCIITFIYRSICKQNYKETKFQFYWDKDMFNTLLSYSGWNLFGAVAGVANNQGINIILNLFFGPVVNAARAIAFQVSSSVNQFVGNFVTAVNPQIIKYYAEGENNKMMNLVFQSSKFSYYLLFVLSMPVLLETNYILTLWLNNIPEYVVIFTRLVLIIALVDSLSYPLMTAAQATGKIMSYQAIVGGMMLLNFPISYCFMKFSFSAETTLYVSLCISFACLFLRLWMLKKLINLSIRKFVKTVLLIILVVSSLSYFIPLLIQSTMHEGFLRFLAIVIIGFSTSIFSIYQFGISVNERLFVMQVIKNYTQKIHWNILNL